MFSYGELLLTLAAAAALFGPKDIPIVARTAGKFVGKAVGYIQGARGQIHDVMKRSQVDQVHKELQETMAQLEAIRYEIRSGMSMSISNPGPKVVMQERHSASLPSRIETASGSETVTSSTATVTPVGFQPGPDGTFSTMPASTGRIAAQRVVVKPIAIALTASPQLPTNSTEVKQDITVLPISAVSAGLLPPRTAGVLPGGADLVLESLTERKVAFDSLEFFQGSDPTLGKQ